MSSGEFWSIGVLAVERMTISAYEEYPMTIIMVQSSEVFSVRADTRNFSLTAACVFGRR
jgi:hypothetical protein